MSQNNVNKNWKQQDIKSIFQSNPAFNNGHEFNFEQNIVGQKSEQEKSQIQEKEVQQMPSSNNQSSQQIGFKSNEANYSTLLLEKRSSSIKDQQNSNGLEVSPQTILKKQAVFQKQEMINFHFRLLEDRVISNIDALVENKFVPNSKEQVIDQLIEFLNKVKTQNYPEQTLKNQDQEIMIQLDETSSIQIDQDNIECISSQDFNQKQSSNFDEKDSQAFQKRKLNISKSSISKKVDDLFAKFDDLQSDMSQIKAEILVMKEDGKAKTSAIQEESKQENSITVSEDSDHPMFQQDQEEEIKQIHQEEIQQKPLPRGAPWTDRQYVLLLRAMQEGNCWKAQNIKDYIDQNLQFSELQNRTAISIRSLFAKIKVLVRTKNYQNPIIEKILKEKERICNEEIARYRNKITKK